MEHLVITFFETLRWQDVVDIILNSYILFRLYVLFKQTNVFRVLVGIAFLWFFQRIAAFLGLIVTSWILQGITAAAALLIIVIFRNEIRSVLQAKNLKTLLWGFPKKAVDTPLEILVDSVYEMARKRTGALIVFPGKEDLEELIHSGIPWRGALSREMILSIFWPDNPVHDGAAIIQGDQVKEVGAVLPLSRRKDLPSHYGTRHRAAAGLAENSDALIVVVSEEKGNVVVAKGAKMRTAPGKDALKRTLEEHLGLPKKGEGHFIKGRLEFGIAALVSVLLICGAWFSFTRGFETFITLDVPIEYMNRDPKMEILDTSVNTVSLDLSGSGSLIRSLQPGQVSVTVDLRHAVPGVNTLPLTRENITLPRGVQLTKINPQVVEVTMDILIKKNLPVQANWVGMPHGDVLISEVRVNPQKVQVIGPAHILKQIATVYTQPIPITNIDKSGKVSTKLALRPASVKLAPDSNDAVTVEYTVRERQG